MKNFLPLSIAAIASTILGTLGVLSCATAVDFDQEEVDQKKFVAIAVPHVGSSPHLVIVEQISESQACWEESGTNPVAVEALLLNFDFTGICARSTDSGGYSLRMAGEDLALLYKIKIVKQNNELLLIGISNTDPNTTAIKIGSTHGIGEGLTKIELEPGWRFTKRTYNGQTVSHIYLTSDLAAPGSISQKR